MSLVRHLIACVPILLLGVSNAPVLAESVVILPAKDNTLIEDPDGAVSNGSGPSIFAGNISGGTSRRAVLLFDVAAQVPLGSVVNSAELRLHVSSSPWGEGESSASGGSGAPATPDDATWIHTFYPNQFWTAPGGDFDTMASASAEVGESGFFAWSGAGMVADVQAWIDGAETNFGWLLRGDESAAATVRLFDSGENPVELLRPALSVDFTPETTQVQAETWGRVKNRYRNGSHR
jgi:hypothetical protein